MKFSIAMLTALVLAGCAMPSSSVTVGAARPTLQVSGAPEGATLLLDGMPVGQAREFDGIQRVLAIEEGPHVVQVNQGSTTIHTQKIFASGGENIKVEAGMRTTR